MDRYACVRGLEALAVASRKTYTEAEAEAIWRAVSDWTPEIWEAVVEHLLHTSRYLPRLAEILVARKSLRPSASVSHIASTAGWAARIGQMRASPIAAHRAYARMIMAYMASEDAALAQAAYEQIPAEVRDQYERGDTA